MPYGSPHTDSIARLMLSRGDAAAEAQRRSGEIWGNALASIGQSTGRTLQDMAKFQEDKPERDLKKVEVADALKKHDEETAIEGALTAGNGDPDKALSVLQNSGNAGAVQTLKTRVNDWRAKQATSLKDTIELGNQQFTRATQLMSTVPVLKAADGSYITSGPEFDKANQLYASVLPKVRELVGAELGKALPDAYDPATVDQANEWGATMAQRLEKQRTAIDLATQAVAAGKDNRDADAYWTKALATALPTASSQEEWDHQLGLAKGLGAKPETLQKFAPTFSKDAVTQAEALGMTAAERAKAAEGPTAGSPEALFRATAAELFPGRPIASLSGKQQATVKKTITDRTASDNGSLVAVTQTDADTGQQTVVLVPKVPNTVVRTTNPDDPGLPRGVKDYIGGLARKPGADGKTPLTFEQAQEDLASQWATLKKDHPRLDPVKADAALRELYKPAPGSGQQSMADLISAMSGGKPAAKPAAAVVPAQPAAPAPKPIAAPSVIKFDVSELPGGKVTVKASDGTTATFPNKAAAQQAMDAFNKQQTTK